jgi:hypothetical protein
VLQYLEKQNIQEVITLTNKIYNPFKKAFWSKGNLFATKEENAYLLGQAKASFAEAGAEFKEANQYFKAGMSEVGKEYKKNMAKSKARKKGKGMTALGFKLLLGVTVPLLLTAFLGIFGLIIGLVIAFIVFKK